MLRIVTSTLTCPFKNCALEHFFFSTITEGVLLMLWQNDKAVMIGRNQTLHAECDHRFCQQHGIPVVRRLSGGGAVYHDLGNSNYSLQMPVADFYDLDVGGRLLLRMLQRKGHHDVGISPRHDLLSTGGKVSGSAYRIARGRAYQHGTLLRFLDKDAMQRALTPRVDVDNVLFGSVRSQVSSIPMTHDDFCHGMTAAAIDTYCCDGAYTQESIKELPRGAEPILAELHSHEWIFRQHQEDFGQKGYEMAQQVVS